MEELDYYQVLEVERKANGEEIKRSYRRLAMKHHPDRNPGDKIAEDRFKQICEAYEVLKDDQKRAAYDRYGHAAFKQGMGGGAGGSPFGGFDFGGAGMGGFADMFSDIFAEFMGGGQGASRAHTQNYARNGNDLRVDVQISLEEAFAGAEKEIRYTTTEACSHCHGFGTADGREPAKCAYCGGSGKIRQARGGFLIMESLCPRCRGAGRLVENPCRHCRGQGAVKADKMLNIKIPAGIEDDTRMRVAGAGEAGLRGGRNGDLYVFVGVKEHKLYKRDGASLFVQVPVSMTAAALGGEIALPGIDGGEVRIQIEPGAQNGQRLKAKGQGMPVYERSHRGDLFVQLSVETPVNLTARQKELLREFDEIGKASGSHANTPGVREFFKGLFK